MHWHGRVAPEYTCGIALATARRFLTEWTKLGHWRRVKTQTLSTLFLVRPERKGDRNLTRAGLKDVTAIVTVHVKGSSYHGAG